MTKRGPGEQLFEVLTILSAKPLRVTHLMYKVNVNCSVLKDLLWVLQTKGYVEFNGDCYSITPEGVKLRDRAAPFFSVIKEAKV